MNHPNRRASDRQPLIRPAEVTIFVAVVTIGYIAIVAWTMAPRVMTAIDGVTLAFIAFWLVYRSVDGVRTTLKRWSAWLRAKAARPD